MTNETMTPIKLISFVFSFRNEEDNIPELVDRVHRAMQSVPNFHYELIFVNDASTDSSLSILLSLQKTFPITIINMSRRFGVTPCYIAGFTQAQGDAIIYMDTDLQDPPEIIPEMIDKFLAGAEVVHTTRIQRDGESPLKMWLTKHAYKIINRFSENRLPINTGDFKLLSSNVVKHILQLEEYDPYMRGLSVWVGFKQDFVHYRREKRFAGETKFPLLTFAPLQEFLRGVTAYSAFPLYFSFFIGLCACLLAIALFFYAIITKIIGVSAPGSSSILIALAFFSGVILISNGITGIYIAKIFFEVKKRPRYIIQNIITRDKAL